jgi:hypothetical protein
MWAKSVVLTMYKRMVNSKVVVKYLMFLKNRLKAWTTLAVVWHI